MLVTPNFNDVIQDITNGTQRVLENPKGLAWERVSLSYFLDEEKAREYLAEFVADHLDPNNVLRLMWRDSRDYSVSPEDMPVFPEAWLPFSLRATKPSFLEYVQAFYLQVAAQADSAAKVKLEEIKKANDSLKFLNEWIAIIGAIDARAPDEAGSEKTREAILTTARDKWPQSITPGESIEDLADDVDTFDNSSEYQKFKSEYTAALESLRLKDGSLPTPNDFKVDGLSDGPAVGRAVRYLQAEANVRGNELQRLMSESSSKISFQSAVNEGFKSFGDKWFQMLTQSSPRG